MVRCPGLWKSCGKFGWSSWYVWPSPGRDCSLIALKTGPDSRLKANG